MLKLLSLFILLAGMGAIANGQAPNIQWQNTLGSSAEDKAWAIEQTADGGYMVAASAAAGNGHVKGHNGGSDFWIVRLNNTGAIKWQKCFGGSGTETPQYMFAAGDNSYIIAGSTNSIDGDVVNPGGGIKPWVIKVDDTGKLVWKRIGIDIIALRQLPGGDLLAATQSNCGTDRFAIAKMDDTLGVKWKKCFGGRKYERITDLDLSLDGGYILTGDYANQISPTAPIKHIAWAQKLDDTGAILWSKVYTDGIGKHICQLPDSSIILAGETSEQSMAAGARVDPDFWLLKMKPNGDTIWQRAYGSNGAEVLYAMRPGPNGHIVMAGYTNGSGGDVSAARGFQDMWVVDADRTGKLAWERALGGTYFEGAADVKITNDQGYILAGFSGSMDGDVSRYIGESDVWVVKLGKALKVESPRNSSQALVYPNPINSALIIEAEAELLHKRAGLYDMLGRQVMSFNLDDVRTEVNTEQLSPGSYYLVVAGHRYERLIIK